MSGLRVIKPGVLSLLQDAGRVGHQQAGMTTGGPLDEPAFDWANALLGNPRGTAVLEVHLGGLRLRAERDLQIALTGADMQARVGDRQLAPWCSHALQAGDVLALPGARAAMRAYLAVPGGFWAPRVAGSCATVMREGLGGLHGDGQPLKAGDSLALARPAGGSRARCVAPTVIPDYGKPLVLRVLPGYQFDAFSAAARADFFTNEYRVGARGDRMGCRLDGPKIESIPGDILSEGIALGAIQIPPDGQPIILLQDRQTIGGYPKLGCVASLDLAALAQAPPGRPLRFARATPAELIAERRAYDGFFDQVPAASAG